jgi:MYXO-CTERM domain-containing protein
MRRISMTMAIALGLLASRVALGEPMPFEGSLRFAISVLPELGGSASTGVADVDLAPYGVSRLALAAHALVVPPTSILAATPSFDPAPLSGVQITASNAAGSLERPSSMAHLGGVMPLHGFAKACLFAPCSGAPLANVVLPLGVVGAGGSTTATAAVNVTVQGAPWTTGVATIRRTVGGVPSIVSATGSSEATASGAMGFNLVTPVFIQTNLPQLPNTFAFVRMLLRVDDEPACSDGADGDGDGEADFPDDPGCASANDLTERDPSLPCDDGADNDGDGAADQDDAGCTGPADPSEQQPGLVCDDGLDQDGDEFADFPADPGCTSAADPAETEPGFACDNGVDDDGDELIDLLDPGCSYRADRDERQLGLDPVCNDGSDQDHDGVADFPFDPGCDAPTDPSERGAPICDDGVDQDGDGRTDFPLDYGCVGPADVDERGVVDLVCDDGLDQDANGVADFPADPGCSSAGDATEGEFVPACANGLDDDDDGAVDGADAGCESSADDAEDIAFGPVPEGQNFLIDGSNALVDESVRVASRAALYLLPGGEVGHRVFGDSFSHISIEGGSIGGELRVRSSAVIRAGSVGGPIRTLGGGVQVFGGTLGGVLEAVGGAIVLHVSDTGGRPFGPVPEVVGQISGTLEDGTPFEVDFMRAPPAAIWLVPEPGASPLGFVALGALALARRRRRRRMQCDA